MSRGDINIFLKNLFHSEGGTNPQIVNQYGYIGKYQFGEDALVDLGYYKPDGTKNRTITGKFKYDWAGEWTGKNGVTSRDGFLSSESVQDKAATEWVKLLCSRAKRFKLQKYIGQTINGIQITESGIIAAAHLRGFGSEKSPGVRQFLVTNGKVDPEDANGTPVSKYMHIFADYDLGCCGSVTTVLIDKNKKPIFGLDYQIKIGNKVVAKGKTNADGATKKIEGLDAGAAITILVKRLEGGYKEIKSFIAREQAALVATLRSATQMVTTQLEEHLGNAGEYRPQSELSKKNSATSNHTARKRKPGKSHGQSANHAHSGAALAKPTSRSGAANAKKGSENKILKSSSVPPNQASKSAGDTGTPIQPKQLSTIETMRNEDGHPVVVVVPGTPPSSQVKPSMQKLEEILLRNVNYGKKKQVLSGPVAAEQSRRGEPISLYKKPREESLGQCYKYVKIALLASGMTKHYLGKEAAKDACGELSKENYRNLLDEPNHGLRSPYDAPVGAVIVYDVTDGSRWGHIEVRVSIGFASDYFSLRPRTTLIGHEDKSTMSGRSRKVSGIWVKD